MNPTAPAHRAVALLVTAAAISSASCLWIRDTDALKKDYGASATSGDGGASSDGGNVGADGSLGDAQPQGDGGCGGPHGPAMMEIPGAGYCIDTTEVTYGQYKEFVAQASPTSPPQRAGCEGNTDFTPVYGSESDEHPVTWIDWCDAVAFCEWAGKRLCGAIGGGSATRADLANPARSQWFRACSEAGKRNYPYGPSYEPERCNGDHNDDAGRPEAVHARDGCEGGYAGLFDMAGNVREWEDACDTSDKCLQRGGAWYDVPGTLACANEQYDVKTDKNPGLGFRCCSK
jgi:formylglycine-generating enzyme required for sulfatase activity